MMYRSASPREDPPSDKDERRPDFNAFQSSDASMTIRKKAVAEVGPATQETKDYSSATDCAATPSGSGDETVSFADQMKNQSRNRGNAGKTQACKPGAKKRPLFTRRPRVSASASNTFDPDAREARLRLSGQARSGQGLLLRIALVSLLLLAVIGCSHAPDAKSPCSLVSHAQHSQPSIFMMMTRGLHSDLVLTSPHGTYVGSPHMISHKSVHAHEPTMGKIQKLNGLFSSKENRPRQPVGS